VAAAAVALLRELLRPIHGSVRDTAALVLRQLTPGLLGLSESGGNASAAQDALAPQRTPAAVRADIVAFATASLECAPRESPVYRSACAAMIACLHHRQCMS
jgi:hypothetical protein